MKYLYIIYKGYIPEILCEEYTGRWAPKIKIIPLPKIIKLGTIFIRIPPPILLIVVIKIVRVSRGAVLIYFSPPLAGGGKLKNKFQTHTRLENKKF